MNRPTGATRRTSIDRDRAIGRIRSITIRTGLAGMAAVGGFGAIAAASSDGASTDGIATAAVTSTSTTSSRSTTSRTEAPTSMSMTTAATSSTGSAHATTGGS